MLGLGIAIIVVGVLIVALLVWALMNKIRPDNQMNGMNAVDEKREPTLDGVDLSERHDTEPMAVDTTEFGRRDLDLNKEKLNLDIEEVLRSHDKDFDDLPQQSADHEPNDTLKTNIDYDALNMDVHAHLQSNQVESIRAEPADEWGDSWNHLMDRNTPSDLDAKAYMVDSNDNNSVDVGSLESTSQHTTALDSTVGSHQHIIVQVMAPRSRTYDGNHLCDVLEDLGLVLSSKGVFLAYDAEGVPEYQVVSMLEPGYFDLNTIDNYQTPGVVFMMDIQFVSDPRPAFKSMLSVVHEASYRLGADILDENRQRLNHAMITEYLARIKAVEIES